MERIPRLIPTSGRWAGKPCYDFGDRLLPVVRGGDDSGEGGAGSGEGSGEGGSGEGQGETQTLTQKQLSDLMAREKNEGKSAGAREAQEKIAKDLGVSVEEAKTLIADARKRADSEKSDAQKAKEAAEAEKAAAEEAKSDAARDRHAAKLERKLIRAGIADEKLDRAVRLLDVEVGAEDSVVDKAVEALKKEESAWFGKGGETAPPGDPTGTPPGKGKGATDAFSKGQERAKQFAGRSQYDFQTQQNQHQTANSGR